MVSLYTGTVPNLTQSQPDFDTNTQAILDYIASLAPELNEWVGAYVQDTTSNSSTSNSVGTGSKTFTVESGKGYKVNMPVRASATTGNYMDGVVTAYSGTSLTVNFTAATGSGTFTSWQIFLTIPGSSVTLGSNTFTGDQFVPDEAYDATAWNGDLSVPTKNSIRDKIEAILGSILNGTNDPTYASTSATEPASPEWTKKVIGYSKTWQEAEYTNTGATFSDGSAKFRALATNYTNSTGSKLKVNIQMANTSNGGSQLVATVGGVDLTIYGGYTPSGSTVGAGNFEVPPGATYQVTLVGGTLAKWWEQR